MADFPSSAHAYAGEPTAYDMITLTTSLHPSRQGQGAASLLAQQAAPREPIRHKPPQLCQRFSLILPEVADWPLTVFLREQEAAYQQRLSALQLSAHLATREDVAELMALRDAQFSVPNSYSTHWLYHLLEQGTCLLLRNATGQLVGYKFEATYAQPQGGSISFTAGTAVHRDYNGLGLGKLLIGYSHLLALQKGATHNQGIIDIVNYRSVANFINAFGGVFIAFEPDFKGYGPRLIYEIPLDAAHYGRQAIDFEAVRALVRHTPADLPYRLIKCDDVRALAELYQHTPYRIVALLPPAVLNSRHSLYLAMPF